MRAKQNFEVVLTYHDVDQLSPVVFQQFVEAEVAQLHARRPAIFGRISLHEVKELARSEEPVNAASPMEEIRKPDDTHSGGWTARVTPESRR